MNCLVSKIVSMSSSFVTSCSLCQIRMPLLSQLLHQKPAAWRKKVLNKQIKLTSHKMDRRMRRPHSQRYQDGCNPNQYWAKKSPIKQHRQVPWTSRSLKAQCLWPILKTKLLQNLWKLRVARPLLSRQRQFPQRLRTIRLQRLCMNA